MSNNDLLLHLQQFFHDNADCYTIYSFTPKGSVFLEGEFNLARLAELVQEWVKQ